MTTKKAEGQEVAKLPCETTGKTDPRQSEPAPSVPVSSEKVQPTAKQQFDEHMADDKATPLERLRFFCSLAFKEPQDWLDVEPFFDAVEHELQSARAPHPVEACIRDAWDAYNRFGAICEFEGQPMIYAAILEEIVHNLDSAPLARTTEQEKK